LYRIVREVEQSNTPIRIKSDVVYLSAGEAHTLAITADGALWGWGYYSDGQLGIDPDDRVGMDGGYLTAPLKLMDNVSAVSAGEYHTMIVRTDGSLWMTGKNSDGQLGVGDNQERYTPAHVQIPVGIMLP
jgi:alpha-tubulin suppressor-like RCC1 family protein